jgi:hypothetical protein
VNSLKLHNLPKNATWFVSSHGTSFWGSTILLELLQFCFVLFYFILYFLTTKGLLSSEWLTMNPCIFMYTHKTCFLCYAMG